MLLLGCFAFSGVAFASTSDGKPPDRIDALPARARGIDVDEHLGQALSTQLAFIDQAGKSVLLSDEFKDGLPVIVTMNYSSCPMLCSLQLDGLVKSMKQANRLLGRDYRIVTVSFDPADSPDKMRKMRERYLRQYGRAVPENAWTMLVGSDANVHAVAESLGIRYNYNEARGEYLHPAVAVVTTPEATIARYLYGLEIQPRTLDWSLLEAASGRTMTTLDRLVLFCFHYDSAEGKYAPIAYNIMRVGAGASALLLAAFLSGFWLFETRQRKRLAEVPRC
jgi:protein SCO1/2